MAADARLGKTGRLQAALLSRNNQAEATLFLLRPNCQPINFCRTPTRKNTRLKRVLKTFTCSANTMAKLPI